MEDARFAERSCRPGIRSRAIRKRQSYIAAAWDRLGYSLERRQACRYPASCQSAFLGWWHASEFRTIKASLENISLEGALVHVDQVPPTQGSVWVCLDGVPPSGWVESQVIELIKERRGSAVVRLKFQETCPFGFFNAAIQQFAHETNPPGPSSSGSGDRSGG